MWNFSEWNPEIIGQIFCTRTDQSLETLISGPRPQTRLPYFPFSEPGFHSAKQPTVLTERVWKNIYKSRKNQGEEWGGEVVCHFLASLQGLVLLTTSLRPSVKLRECSERRRAGAFPATMAFYVTCILNFISVWHNSVNISVHPLQFPRSRLQTDRETKTCFITLLMSHRPL